MTEAVKILTFVDLMFIILLMLSGTVGGYAGEIVYYLAFVLPILVGFYASLPLKRKREEISEVAEKPDNLLLFNLNSGKMILPLIVPFVTVIFTVSFLTSLLLSLIGVSTPPVTDVGLLRMLLVHAVVPAFFEEILFRYIPMKLLLPYSRRYCVIYSALCFALIHCSFTQMPYAFVAGVLFMLIDVAFESIWPSVILHFINNAASVVWIKCSGNSLSMWVFVAVLFGLAVISVPFIYRKRREYLPLLKSSFEKGEVSKLTYAPFTLVVVCCYVAFANLFS